ncbi:translation initiation factor IF-1 [Iamia sp. SCSIO 61187]|uniref:translation initiation factor IF-1 n=1 Tax=Iamia sp. SCSIO 61187 TaxID=2722752 RepID=UPI001C62B59C|nr:translation initiation factor IF-1 [Iamia sp. SCSIO 61187]QYG94653.1 translation initiation factor IF-1 [Iamia sp. SCSIO 61187]
MAKVRSDQIVFEGTVAEAMRGGTFRVELENDHLVLAHISGRLRRNRIRVLPGDRVQLEVSPYELGRGRITYRFG